MARLCSVGWSGRGVDGGGANSVFVKYIVAKVQHKRKRTAQNIWRPKGSPFRYMGLFDPAPKREAVPAGKVVSYKGVRITPTYGGFRTSIDRESILDTMRDAKRFVDSHVQNRKRGRRNPESAAAVYRDFHGEPPKRSTDYIVTEFSPREVAALGDLIYMDVRLRDGTVKRLAHPRYTGLNGSGPVKTGITVATSSDRGQLYLAGGDQAVNLAEYGIRPDDLPKHQVVLGTIKAICYLTRKGFDQFQSLPYEHRFGEDGGALPVLGYDVKSRLLWVAGGSYHNLAAGITN